MSQISRRYQPLLVLIICVHKPRQLILCVLMHNGYSMNPPRPIILVPLLSGFKIANFCPGKYTKGFSGIISISSSFMSLTFIGFICNPIDIK